MDIKETSHESISEDQLGKRNIHVDMIASHFQDEPLERPLHTKRRRVLPKLEHSIRVGMIASHFQNEPLARPLRPKRRRVQPKLEHGNDDQPVPSSISAAPTAPQSRVPTPTLFIECEMTQTPQPFRLSHDNHHLVKDDKTSAFLHYGSEEESESEDEEKLSTSGVRVQRAAQEMTEDTEEEAAAAGRVHVAEGTDDDDKQMHEPTTLFKFNWQVFPSTPIAPRLRRERFVGISGPTIDPIPSVYDAFVAIWDREIITHIVGETNIYAQQYCEELLRRGELSPASRIAHWKDTDVNEIYTFFALLIAMGLVVKSQQKDYWLNVNNPEYTPFFPSVMPLKRFQILAKCLHFNRNGSPSLQNLTPSQAKLFKIEPIVRHLNSKFSTLYGLGQNIALDESLTHWKGWLDIKQYIPNKAAITGIKTYEVCDSHSGYLWRFECNVGGKVPDQGIVSGRIPNLVLWLLRGLEHRGHTVWMDNYYNSPSLARILKSIGYDCVGTINTNRQFVPSEITALKKSDMTKGQICGSTSGDVDLIVWLDRNRVAMISTYHGTGVSHGKPIVVRDYNVCMGGVDKKDQMLSAYPIERKQTQVWYKKFFSRLLNVSVLNAYILYKYTHSITHRKFRRELVLDLLKNHHEMRAITIDVRAKKLFSDEIKRHLPSALPIIPNAVKGGRYRRKCVHCNVKRTNFICEGCKVALCADFTKPQDEVCFILYHSTNH